MHLPAPEPAFRWSAEPWGHALRCLPLESVAQHLFTARQLQLRSGSQPTAWAAAAASLGAGVDRLMRVRQVHGATVRVLRRAPAEASEREATPDADAIVSNEADLLLAVQVADCVPLLMADRRSGAAAAIHAGWRGSCAGIAAAAIDAMAREFGTRPADLTVAMGPSIGACCYEVGPELVAAFRQAGADEAQIARWFTRTDAGSLRLDLWSVNRDQMLAAGVAADRLHLSRLCTQTHLEVFDSYRADGPSAGRMAAVIRVPDMAHQ